MAKHWAAGLKNLHSWAFLGDSARIATASDGVFLYTPAGPNKQLDLFLRAHEMAQCGKLEARNRASVRTKSKRSHRLSRHLALLQVYDKHHCFFVS